MGLDMYLEKINRGALQYAKLDPDEAKEQNPVLYAKMKPYLLRRGNPPRFHWESLYEEVGYWRKANHIHNWFVENVQGGEDDCGYYEVTAEQLTELRDLCIAVATKSVMVMSKVTNGYQLDGTGAMNPILQDGLVIVNPEVAEELLPTQGGFFFGSTDYDEYYMADVTDTIDILNKVLRETDFSVHAIYYTSSW